MGVGEEPQSGRLQYSLAIFQVLKCGLIVLKMSQHNIIANFMAYIIISWIVTFSKVAACTNQPVGFSGHLSTHEYLTGLKNKLSKSRPSSFWQ